MRVYIKSVQMKEQEIDGVRKAVGSHVLVGQKALNCIFKGGKP